MNEEDFCYCHNDDTDEYHDCNVVFNNKLLTVLSDMINFIIHEK